MIKNFQTIKKWVLKLVFLSVLLIMISCSKETTVGPDGDRNTGGAPIEEIDFKLVLRSFGTFTSEEIIKIHPFELVENNNEKILKNVKFWTGVADCSGVMAGIAARAAFLNPSVGVEVELGTNKENLLSYRVTFSNDEESDCAIAGSIIHDDVIPGVVNITDPNLKTNQTSLHLVLGNISTDAKDINVYLNGSIVKSHTLNASVWRGGNGFLTVPLNQTTTYRFEVVDFAGNLSPLSSPLEIEHSNILPDSPIFSVNSLTLQNGIVTTSTVTIDGSLSVNTDGVKIYSNNLFGSPLKTITKAEFESGTSLSLTNGIVNNFLFVAFDTFGNESSPSVISLKAVQTPIYDYKLTSTSLFADSQIAINKVTRVRVIIPNSSIETTLQMAVPVTSFSASDSSPNISIDSTEGCPISNISASSSCDLYINASYPTVGLKTETIQVNLNGTVINVDIEIEVVDQELRSLNSSQLSSLGEFKKVSLTSKHLIFENGVVSVDLEDMVLNPTLASQMEEATHNIQGNLVYLDSGKVRIITEGLTSKVIQSTRSYSPGAIVDLKVLNGNIVALVSNSFSGQDILIDTVGEVLNQSVSSNLGVTDTRIYFRSGSSLNHLDENLSVASAAGLIVSGDIFTKNNVSMILGSNGGVNSLYKLSGSLIEDTSELLGATNFLKITDDHFGFQTGSNFGLYNGKTLFSNATQSISNTDIKSSPSVDSSEIFSVIDIKTSLGDRTVISKYSEDENSLYMHQLDKSVYGSLIGGPLFDKDGDIFISNQAGNSLVISRGGEEDYNMVSNIQTIPNIHFDQSISTSEHLIFSSSQLGNSRINTIELNGDNHQVTLDYFTPSDISLGGTISMIPTGDSTVLVYYPNDSSTFSFKIIQIL